jgi:transcription elongation factor GreB
VAGGAIAGHGGRCRGSAQGDRSENAEYTYGKKRLREIDARVRHLQRRLDGMVIVNQPPSDPRRVFFGAWVELEDATGTTHRYRIVGPDEFDRAPGYISMDAPLARALLGKTLDAEVSLSIAGDEHRYDNGDRLRVTARTGPRSPARS